MVFALVFTRGAINALDNPARQSFVTELVGPDRTVNAVALNSVIVHSARIVGPAAAGAVIALLGVGPVFPDQRALLRGDDRRALGHGPRAARHPRARPAAARRPALRPGLRAPDAGAADPAGDDGPGRDALLQLPDPAAAAGRLHLARHGDHLRAADDRDGRRLRARRAAGGRARARGLAAARVGRRRVRAADARRRRGADAAAADRRADPARDGHRHLRGGRELDAAARGRPRDARARDGAVLGGLPRLDADRRPAGRLAGGRGRAARRARGRRGRRAARRCWAPVRRSPGSASRSPRSTATPCAGAPRGRAWRRSSSPAGAS